MDSDLALFFGDLIKDETSMISFFFHHSCLMSCAWKEDKCRIGLIIGTGTNACYLENIDAIKTVDASDSNGEDHMIINTEWG